MFKRDLNPGPVDCKQRLWPLNQVPWLWFKAFQSGLVSSVCLRGNYVLAPACRVPGSSQRCLPWTLIRSPVSGMPSSVMQSIITAIKLEIPFNAFIKNLIESFCKQLTYYPRMSTRPLEVRIRRDDRDYVLHGPACGLVSPSDPLLLTPLGFRTRGPSCHWRLLRHHLYYHTDVRKYARYHMHGLGFPLAFITTKDSWGLV
ncbi:hypothetical protein VNO77_19428 [Canavalia gladiata]|uniref:Uncharacterized protein n=1 Tax=Canavalia gladiata TaxID=3824 RepID=A0AAN9QLD7_CANGL